MSEFWVAFFESDAWLLIAVGFILGTFDRLMNWLEAGIAHFQFMFVIDPYEEGVVVRLGKYHRSVGEGWHFMIPFGIEEIMKDTVVRTTSYLEVQSITSADGYPVNLNAVIVYKIGNIKRWLLEVDDAETAIQDMTYGIITEMAEEHDWDEILLPGFMKEVTDRVRKEAVTWGARIEAVKLSDRVQSKSLRLWTGGDSE
jgi:membrane protease subunit HflK